MDGLRRQQDRSVPGRPRKLVLLGISSDEDVEAELHHRHMQEIGGSNRLGQPIGSQNRSSLSWESSSVAVGPWAGPSGKCCFQ